MNNLEETFRYDNLNRLTEIRLGGVCIAMEEHVGNTLRTKRYVGSCEFVTLTGPSGTQAKSLTFLTGPTGVYAVVVTEDNVNTVHYVLKDNLGSWTAVTDSEGNLEQRLSYDAWGNLRYPRTWENYPIGEPFAQPLFDRGFTGHEHLWNFGLINMNGRMYDPLISSFLSVDRFLQDPSSAQGFNRYAYCMHNPLRYVDPTGFLLTPGNRSHPDDPLPQVVVDGQANFVLPEVTITPFDDSPPSWNEFHYTPSASGGGSLVDWGSLINGNGGGSTLGQGGGNGGNMGNGTVSSTPESNSNYDADLEIAADVLLTINLYTTIESSFYYNRLTRTWRDKMDIFRSFDFHGNGSTGGMNSYGKLMSNRFAKASGLLSGIGIGLSGYDLMMAKSTDDRIKYGADMVFGCIGFLPGGTIITTFWFFGGRNLVFMYGENMGDLIKDGINPGLPVYQPFK